MNQAKIAKLCNEIEDIACDISQQTMDDIISAESRMIFDKAKEIAAEISTQPKSNADRVPIAKTFYRTRFCPNCGARMDGGADNDG